MSEIETKKPFAIGSEKVAYKLEPDFIRLESRVGWKKEGVYSLFHLATIAHVLFPENIPKPILIDIDKITKKYYTIFENINHDPVHSRITELRNKNAGFAPFGRNNPDVKEFTELRDSLDKNLLIEELRTKIHSAGMNKYEINGNNIIMDADGKPIFVDFRPAFTCYESNKKQICKLNFDILKLNEYINKFCTKVQRDIVREELSRILELLSEFISDDEKSEFSKYLKYDELP